MHLFSPRHSSNKFGSALGLSKTLIISYPLVRLFLCRNTVPEEVGASSRSVELFRTADTFLPVLRQFSSIAGERDQGSVYPDRLLDAD